MFGFVRGDHANLGANYLERYNNQRLVLRVADFNQPTLNTGVLDGHWIAVREHPLDVIRIESVVANLLGVDQIPDKPRGNPLG